MKLCITLLASLSCLTATAAERYALVIGNSTYPADGLLVTPLPNCIPDARLVATTLEGLGFRVTKIEDASKSVMDDALLQWEQSLPKGCDALVYFAGHGIEHNGKNYLLGSNSKLKAQSRIGEEALEAETVAQAMLLAGAKSSFLFLDCCREAPPAEWVTRGLRKRGLADVKVDGDIIIAYAAKPGDSALDECAVTGADVLSGHGPYAQAVVKYLPQGLKHTDFFQQVRREVARLTSSIQRTWENGSFLDEFYFSPPGSAPVMPAPPALRVDPFASVSKTTPFTNSLGMKFVPAGTPGVLFSVWETRVKDFTAFVEETNHDAIGNSTFGAPAYTLEKTADGQGTEWAQKGGSWHAPRFPSKQTGEHPVVCVSYLDAEAFCAWLTKKDRNSGKIPATASYRLPTDSEWSRACVGSKYPWGDSFPTGSSAGNYSGKEAMVGVYEGFSNDLVKAGRRDSAARTSAVGMFDENRYGLYDMGGNVVELCTTWYEASMNEADVLEAFPVLKDDKGGQTYRVLRGASWSDYAETFLRSSYRTSEGPRIRDDRVGFRCVLVVAGG